MDELMKGFMLGLWIARYSLHRIAELMEIDAIVIDRICPEYTQEENVQRCNRALSLTPIVGI